MIYDFPIPLLNLFFYPYMKEIHAIKFQGLVRRGFKARSIQSLDEKTNSEALRWLDDINTMQSSFVY
ncbi:MAG: hypothetical protein ACTSWN_09140 [Promethearchaeota archaeon]